MSVGIHEFLTISSLLFCIGMFGVLFRRNTIIMLMSLELMLNAVNLGLVGFSRHNNDLDGSLLSGATGPVMCALALLSFLLVLSKEVAATVRSPTAIS